jgi:hypothetical protein
VVLELTPRHPPTNGQNEEVNEVNHKNEENIITKWFMNIKHILIQDDYINLKNKMQVNSSMLAASAENLLG